MEKVEYADYHTFIPRFVKQEGQSCEHYVDASNHIPAVIRIPSMVLRDGVLVPQAEDRFLRKVRTGATPDEPKASHPLAVSTEPVNTAIPVEDDGARRSRRRSAE